MCKKEPVLIWRLLSLMILLVLGTACSSSPLPAVEPVAVVPTLVELATMPAAASTAAAPTRTPSPTLSPISLATTTSTPVNTPELVPDEGETAVPTPSPSPLPTITTTPTLPPIDRTCPDPPPLRPDYPRQNLGAEPWPTPDPALAGLVPHFDFIKPVAGGGRTIINKTYPYGSDGGNRYLLHNGIDISGDFDLPVLAVADGTVIVAQRDEQERYGWRCEWYGQLVILELEQTWLGQPIYVLYGHVLDIMVEPGQQVSQGEMLAEVGVGGAAIAPHLHLEVRVGRNSFDSTRNPMLWIGPGSTRGVVTGRLVDPDGRPWQGFTITLVSGSGEEIEFINTYSYMGDDDGLIHPDEALGENFLFADVPPGSYILFARIQGEEYRQPVTVTGGEITFVELITSPFKTPTPPATETAAP